MMAPYFAKHGKSASLNDQIRHAERQVLHRQRRVESRAAALIGKIHRQLTSPATLLLAGGSGFIIGELTRPATCQYAGNTVGTDETITPLRTALNLIAAVHAIYTALPLVWFIKSFYQPTPPR